MPHAQSSTESVSQFYRPLDPGSFFWRGEPVSRRKGRTERANAKRERQLFGLAPSGATCLLLVWLVPFAVLLYTAPRGIEESVRVLDPPAESTLSGEATWSPPLSLILPDGDLAEWPYLIFALFGATLFAAIELILARSTSG